jgi:hypothetical protein
MAAISSATLWKSPRRRRLLVSSANQRSIRFNQEQFVGVKCNKTINPDSRISLCYRPIARATSVVKWVQYDFDKEYSSGSPYL